MDGQEAKTSLFSGWNGPRARGAGSTFRPSPTVINHRQVREHSTAFDLVAFVVAAIDISVPLTSPPLPPPVDAEDCPTAYSIRPSLDRVGKHHQIPYRAHALAER